MSANYTPEAPSFKKICFMHMKALQNFPYIEADFDALTNYELLSKIVEYLNQVISNNNEQNDVVTNLYNAYVSLQNYINNYFENLDVQDEINNKLENMAQSGELTFLIKSYIDPIQEAYEEHVNGELANMNSSIDYYKLVTNNRIAGIETQINNLESGSPIPVNSTSDMTDTAKLYVLTTNGYVYYYDGTAWVQGWIYQSTGISETDPVIQEINEKIDDAIKTYVNIFDKTQIVLNKSPKSTTIDDLADTPGANCSGIIPCKGETTYSFSSHISGGNNVFFYNANGTYLNRLPIVEQADHSWQVTTLGSNMAPSYMRFQYAPAYVNLNTFMIVEGTSLPEEYQPYGKYINPNYLREQDDAISENSNKITALENSFSEQNNIIDIFNKGVCIGDSITEGAFNYTYPTTGIIANGNYSYPTYLHKLTNINIDNYGRSSYTAPQYAEAYAQHDWSGYDFAIIMFGINDVLQNVSPSDSMAGITSIINSLKSYNNNIKIFLSTITPAYTDGTNMFDDENDAIRTLANSLSNVYLVDLNQISICHKNTPYVNGHLTALGYNQTAREFMYSISNIIKENMSSFNKVQFIGTNYDF